MGANTVSLSTDLLTLSSLSVLVLYALGCPILLLVAQGMISTVHIKSAVSVSAIFLTPIKQTKGPHSSPALPEPSLSPLLGPGSKLQRARAPQSRAQAGVSEPGPVIDLYSSEPVRRCESVECTQGK